MPLTRVQFKQRADKLMRKINSCKLQEASGIQTLCVAKSTLEFYLQDVGDSSSSSDSSFTLPESAEVIEFMRDLMPAASELFNDRLYKNPLFPYVVLFEVGQLFGCEINPGYLQAIDLPQHDLSNKRILLHVWLCEFYDCNVETCQDILRRYSSARRSNTASLHSNRSIPQYASLQEVPSPSQSRDPPANSPVNNAHIQDGPRHNEFTQNHFKPDESKKANYVLQMFKDNKFSGDIAQDINETFHLYGICAHQYNLNQRQRADYLVHVFDGAARKFFFTNVNQSMSYQEMVQVMMAEYVSDARQMQIKGTLETLRLSTFMEEKKIDDVSEGLTVLVNHVNELTPQCPPDFRSDAHKVDYLRKAVTEFPEWSRIPIQSITSQNYSFNNFVTSLHESIQNLRQIQLLSKNNGSSSLTGIVSPEFLTNLTRYGRNPRRNNFGRSSNNAAFTDARRRNECFRCGAPNWTKSHRCAKGAVISHTRNRLRNGESSAHIVAELVHDLEGGNSDDSESAVDLHLSEFESHLVGLSNAGDATDTGHVDAMEATDCTIFETQIAQKMSQDSESTDFRQGNAEI